MPVFTVIDHQEFTGATTEWSKTSIPTSYDHLLVKASTRSTRSGAEYGAFTVKLNSSSEADNYFVVTLDASTATPISTIEPDSSGASAGYTGEFQGGRQPAADAVAWAFSTVTMWIPHYANTTNYKQILLTQMFPNDSTTDDEWQVSTRACVFKFSTDDKRAVDAVAMRRNWNDFAEYSTFTLYGITGA